MRTAYCCDILLVLKLAIPLHMQTEQGAGKNNWQETKVILEKSILPFYVKTQCCSLQHKPELYLNSNT